MGHRTGDYTRYYVKVDGKRASAEMISRVDAARSVRWRKAYYDRIGETHKLEVVEIRYTWQDVKHHDADELIAYIDKVEADRAAVRSEFKGEA